jgi:hypothetical protein
VVRFITPQIQGGWPKPNKFRVSPDLKRTLTNESSPRLASEREVLFKSGCWFKVLEYNGKRVYIELEEIVGI